jgi:hypothetical protein
MKIVLAGIAAAILLGIVAGVVLPSVREPAYQAFSTSSTRVGEPGSNLVGSEWQHEKR